MTARLDGAPSPNEAAMLERWGPRLRALGWHGGEGEASFVTAHSRDGIYFFFGNGDSDIGLKTDIRLIILGPMTKTPGELACDIDLGRFWVKEVGVLPLSPQMPETVQQILRNRGCWFVHLRDCDAQELPIARAMAA